MRNYEAQFARQVRFKYKMLGMKLKHIKRKNKPTQYDPLELICVTHNVKFIKFICEYKDINIYSSHGCPVCVGLIRAKVQLEFNRCCIIAKNGNRMPKNQTVANRGRKVPNGPKRGRPKTKTIAAIVETGNGI